MYVCKPLPSISNSAHACFLQGCQCFLILPPSRNPRVLSSEALREQRLVLEDSNALLILKALREQRLVLEDSNALFH